MRSSFLIRSNMRETNTKWPKQHRGPAAIEISDAAHISVSKMSKLRTSEKTGTSFISGAYALGPYTVTKTVPVCMNAANTKWLPRVDTTISGIAKATTLPQKEPCREA